MRRPRLLFVSPLFLFPTDAGGKIRTTNILRGLKGGHFDIRLMSPALPEQVQRWAAELKSVCDEFVHWSARTPLPRARRVLDLLRSLPVNVAADVDPAARRAVAAQLDRGDVDLVVFDFVHAHVLRPTQVRVRTVCFTHNVEAEIFGRHATAARDPLRRWVWQGQHRKMVRFEKEALQAYDKVIAVSERDARHFGTHYGLTEPEAIPTGVDLDQYAWAAPPAVDDEHPPTVVYVASMDSAANIDAVSFFLRQAWPAVLARHPRARFVVVGRNPPASLVALGRRSTQVEITGFVPDVRPYLRAAHAAVIPLLVGGGTRIKAFELMASGVPVVSTAVGIEGLSLEPGVHHLEANDAEGLAQGVNRLLSDAALRVQLSRQAREFVESRFGHKVASQVFEDICRRTLTKAGA